MYTVEVVKGGARGADVDVAAPPAVPVSVSVTGHTVVYRLITSVVTDPILAGQLVTVGAQDVIVYTEVV